MFVSRFRFCFAYGMRCRLLFALCFSSVLSASLFVCGRLRPATAILSFLRAFVLFVPLSSRWGLASPKNRIFFSFFSTKTQSSQNNNNHQSQFSSENQKYQWSTPNFAWLWPSYAAVVGGLLGFCLGGSVSPERAEPRRGTNFDPTRRLMRRLS